MSAGLKEGAMACMNYDCPHNVFWKKTGTAPKDHPLVEEIDGCMLNVEREYTLEEIGQIYGLCRERVRLIQVRLMGLLANMADRELLEG